MSEALRDADRRARLDAIERFEGHMILEAGAGTGKTTVLVDRVLAWGLGAGYDAALAGGDTPETPGAVSTAPAAKVFEQVAALTFSEAAAAEMEARISGALRELAAGAELPRDLAAVLDPSTAAVRAAALLDHCDRLQVTTIHAFCRKLLASYPLEAGVAPGFRVDASGRAAARAARDAVGALLDDADASELEDLVALARRGCGAPQLETLLGALLASPVSPERFAADPLSAGSCEALGARLRGALATLASAESTPSGCWGDAARRAADALGQRTPHTPESLGEVLRTLRDEVPAARLRAGRRPGASEEAAVAAHACAMDPATLVRLHRVLAPRFAAAAEALRAEGALELDELLRRTRDLLRDEPGVGVRLRGSLRQLLVDEFQDTDAIQCEIVELLALEPGGPRLFVVGDPKQSIYAWRSADLRAYDACLSRLDAAGATRRRLAVSHRSLPVILDEVERAVAPLMVREVGVQPAFEPLLASADQRARSAAGGGGVEYWIAQRVDATGAPATTSSADSLELETRALTQDLWRLHREERVAWETIGLLLRSTGELDRYLDALRRAEIPYAVDRDRVYFRRREVVEARALLRLLLDPNDDLAWVATLRSARCGVPDAAWLPLFRDGVVDLARRALGGEPFAQTALPDAVGRAADAVAGLDVPGLAALAGWELALLDFVDTLVALRRSFERDPFELFLARVRRLALVDLSEGARYLGRYRLANLERFFREIAELYADGDGALAPVLRELRRQDLPVPEGEESRPPGMGTDAVQVMTIHGAKGLDFEHVYLLQAHKTGGVRNEPGVLAESGEGAERELDYALRWGLRANAVVATPGWYRAERRRAESARAELIRTLYVAMTRAKTRLVVSGRLAEGGASASRSHADCLTPCLAAGLPDRVTRRVLGAESLAPPAPDAAAATACAGDPRPATGARREDAWVHAGRPYTVAASSSAAPEARYDDGDARSAPRSTSTRPAGARSGYGAAIGTAVHAFLEHYDFGADDPAPAAGAALRAHIANRVPEPDRGEAEAAAREVLERMRESPLWERLRALEGHVLGRELPLVARPPAAAASAGPASGDALGAAPVGAFVGTIDLLYRDPDDGEVVVVDFKSDRVDDETALRARAAHYAPQGRVYCDAVADALGLAAPGRFELWFLRVGRCVATRFELPAPEAKSAHNVRGPATDLG